MEGVGVNPSFWRGRRVLLTGHTGFKGSWLALWLNALGAEVSALSLAPEADALWPRLAPAPVAHDAVVDIRSAEAVGAEVRAAAPEIVLHLAAQAIVRRGYEDPAGTFATNVQGTINLLDALRSVDGVRAVLVVTSDKVYGGTPGPDGFVESDALGGADPYSASKAACEIAVAGYADAILRPRGVAVATARAGNVVGGGDMGQHRLLPDIVRALCGDGRLSLRAPEGLRPWLHVLDALGGYLALAEAMVARPHEAPRALNFGPDQDSRRPVRALVDEFCAAWGASPAIALGEALPVEPKPLWLDSARARRALGWAPRLAFQDTVRWTVDWWQRTLRGEAESAVCLSQIRAYGERCQ